MRVLASLVAATAVALTAVPAQAITRTIHVPILDCSVTVTTSDFLVSASTRGVRAERWGENGASSNC